MKRHLNIQPKLATSRLRVDIITLEDYEFIFSLVNSEGWIQYIGDRNIHSKEDAIKYVDKILDTDNLIYWVVRITDTNTPVGIISFLKRSYLEHFDIGFAFLPEFNGNGYAYESAKEILSMISEKPEYHHVLATTIPVNIKSIQLLLKLGFVFKEEIEIENIKLHIYTNTVS